MVGNKDLTSRLQRRSLRRARRANAIHRATCKTSETKLRYASAAGNTPLHEPGEKRTESDTVTYGPKPQSHTLYKRTGKLKTSCVETCHPLAGQAHESSHGFRARSKDVRFVC